MSISLKSSDLYLMIQEFYMELKLLGGRGDSSVTVLDCSYLPHNNEVSLLKRGSL